MEKISYMTDEQRKTFKELLVLANKEYRKNNPEKYREARRRYRDKHREHIRAYNTEYVRQKRAREKAEKRESE